MAYNPNAPAPTNRVQDDIAAMRDNFQHLAPLAQAVEELQAVSELAPYIQAILGSRIVDHNLDVTNPPNGYYVRWDNGLQVCFLRSPQISIEPGNQRASNIPELRQAYAAVFLSSPFVALTAQHGSSPLFSRIYHDTVYTQDSRTHCAIGVRNEHTQPLTVSFNVIALGRWK